jgi:hypothetical protein
MGICLLHKNSVTTAYTAFQTGKDMAGDTSSWIEDELMKRYFTVGK